jgi:putative two-component system response regulator
LEDVLSSVTRTADQSAAAVLKCLSQVALARGETLHQQVRMQEYVRVLLNLLKAHPSWVAFADPTAVEDVVRCSTARNVGLVALNAKVPGGGDPLEPAGSPQHREHPAAGVEFLTAVASEYGANLKFLRTAQAVIRHHHERWDGSGYPDKLARERIPHAARVVAVADAYDALRLPSGNEPGLTHLQAVNALTAELPGYFDPVVIDAFRAVNLQFDAIFAECQPAPPPATAPKR